VNSYRYITKRSRMRSAKDLYEETPLRTSTSPWKFRRFFDGVVDEDRIPEEANTRVELRILLQHRRLRR